MDTRRKITFYLNPETNEADRFVCQKTDETPQGKGDVYGAPRCLQGLLLESRMSVFRSCSASY